MFIKYLTYLLSLSQALCSQLESDKTSLNQLDLNDLDDDIKVVGGEQAPFNYSYQLSLQRPSTGFSFFPRNFSHFCGGCIVSENYFLTAAHCMVDQNISEVSVLAGTNNLRDDSKGYRHPIDSCLIHPNFVSLNSSDIALCKVKIPFVLGDNVGTIALDKTYVDGGVNCTLTGWGSTSMWRWPLPFISYLIFPDDLRKAFVPTITNDECRQRKLDVGRTQVCTFARFGRGACAG